MKYFSYLNTCSKKVFIKISFAGFVFFSLPYCLFAQPDIRSFNPASGPTGTSVTIKGRRFSPVPAGNVVHFGAVRAVVSSASDTALTVTVPIGASYKPITITVNAHTAYADKPFVVTFPSNNTIDVGSFAAPAEFQASANPRNVAVVDINGDNKPDLAVANQTAGTLSVFKNVGKNGTILFASKIDFTAGSGSFDIAYGDFDGDGKPDLAVTNANSGGSSTVSIFKNTSSGQNISFANKIDYECGASATGVAVGDLDGDGKPDLVVASVNSVSIFVFKNTSTPQSVSFAPGVSYNAGRPERVSIGDLSGDGKPEIVIADFNGFVSVFKNESSQGNISLGTKMDFEAGSFPVDVSIGDLDGDNKPDLVVANFVSNNVSVLRSTSFNGGISFAPKENYATGENPQIVSIGDADGDGKVDLAVNSNTLHNASILKNTSTKGNISFMPKVDFAATYNPTSAKLDDLNGDGKPDLIIANNTLGNIAVYKNIIPAQNVSAYAKTTSNTGVNDNTFKEPELGSINVSPNPSANKAVLHIPGNFVNATVHIADANGKIVMRLMQIKNNSTPLPVEKFAKGIYFITVLSEQGSKVVKLIKE